MSDQKSDAITMLDQMVSEDRIQIMKAALPYVPANGQKMFSVFAKVLELQNTLSMFSQPQSEMKICATSSEPVNPMDMLQDLRRFCNGGTQKKIDNMINMMVMMQMFEMTQDSGTST